MGSESKNGVGSLFSPGTKKMIQSLREVVNCPEPEIYAVLKECNMDPNDAVQRLLSLDTFHEVKSKRERRKEMKDTQDSRPRVSSRGVRGSSERNAGWSGSSQTSYNDLGKAAYKGQNGFVASSPHPPISHFMGRTTNHQPSSHSDSLSTSIGSGDAIYASMQPSPGNQSTWLGTSSGHLSMADIVKMGRQPSKDSHISPETSWHQDAFATNSYNVETSQASAFMESEMHQYTHSQNSCVSEMIHKSGHTGGQNAFHDEWPVIEQPTAVSGSSLNANVEMHTSRSNSYINESNMPRDYRSNKVQVSEADFSSENLTSDYNASASASSRQKIVDASGRRSYCADDMSSNSSSYDSHQCAYENEEGKGIRSNLSYPNQSASNDVVVAVSSATMNMQQLNLGKEEPADCTVVLPNNLQELAADCSHLSFGTYKAGISSAVSRPPSNSLKNDLGGASAGIEISSAGHLDTRNSGYNHDEPLGSLYNTERATIDAKKYDLSVPLQPELIKQDILEATLGHKDITTSSLPDFYSENVQRTSSGLSFARADPKFRNIPQSDMAYSDSIRSDLSESTFQSLRGSDILSQFLGKPSMASRYSSAVSSINSPTISMSEAVRPGALPSSEASSVLPQHLTARSYSQPTLPYEQLANIIGYPSVPQSYSGMPSNLQQAYLGGSALHQSMAGVEYSFPQYRSGASISRLPPSAAAAGGHGNFGTSTNIHGSFLHNSSATPISTSDYDDVLRSQYKDGNHLTPLHQSSRTMSSVPDIAYNNQLGQNQQYGGYGQGQLPSQSQHYRSLGYPDLYHSQMGPTQDHQRQNLNDLALAGIPDLSPQQLHQIWQRTY